MKVRWLIGLVLLAASARAEDALVHADDFSRDLSQWAVEQMPGGRVFIERGRLVIDDAAGCTVWFRAPLRAPVTIRYRATVSARSRVSDLNCFWMASDPAHPGALIANAARRTGKFEDYDRLATYYVGCGGNENTTTRFRRYDGAGAKPLRADHDRRERRFLLEGDRTYQIEIRVDADGRVRWSRDGEVCFDFTDPQPLREGWFGFRTVHSRIEIADFQVTAPAGSPAGR
ncbi:DUF6250 domain-containing protein [Oleiharenicola sp. Vm1]|uniref:DUF6250 domain-containing protein n=1 Tax=Oleiharenicola sp. Vm1 TaxID=3398393 RepID=UPI0039F48C7C